MHVLSPFMFGKDTYRYEYINSWQRFNTSLPKNKELYSNLKMEGITDDDYEHVMRVWENFRTQDLWEHHDLYMQSDTLLSADCYYHSNTWVRKNIFTCLLCVHSTISLLRHEQLYLIRLRFERCFSHHRVRWWEKYLSKRSVIRHTCSWHDKLIVL